MHICTFRLPSLSLPASAIHYLNAMDYCTVVDVKAKDTVWSARLAGEWPAGTTFTVTKLAINHNPDAFSPFQPKTFSV